MPPGADEVEFWSDPILTVAETYSLQFPDIVVPDGLAETIGTKGKVSRRFASNVVESPRARYGGVVRDEEGRPIEGVALALSYSSKPGFGASGLAVSKEDGRWSFC